MPGTHTTFAIPPEREHKSNLPNILIIRSFSYSCLRYSVCYQIFSTGDQVSEYVKKGFALNDARLKNPKLFGDDYFDELRKTRNRNYIDPVVYGLDPVYAVAHGFGNFRRTRTT